MLNQMLIFNNANPSPNSNANPYAIANPKANP